MRVGKTNEFPFRSQFQDEPKKAKTKKDKQKQQQTKTKQKQNKNKQNVCQADLPMAAFSMNGLSPFC